MTIAMAKAGIETYITNSYDLNSLSGDPVQLGQLKAYSEVLPLFRECAVFSLLALTEDQRRTTQGLLRRAEVLIAIDPELKTTKETLQDAPIPGTELAGPKTNRLIETLSLLDIVSSTTNESFAYSEDSKATLTTAWQLAQDSLSAISAEPDSDRAATDLRLGMLGFLSRVGTEVLPAKSLPWRESVKIAHEVAQAKPDYRTTDQLVHLLTHSHPSICRQLTKDETVMDHLQNFTFNQYTRINKAADLINLAKNLPATDACYQFLAQIGFQALDYALIAENNNLTGSVATLITIINQRLQSDPANIAINSAILLPLFAYHEKANNIRQYSKVSTHLAYSTTTELALSLTNHVTENFGEEDLATLHQVIESILDNKNIHYHASTKLMLGKVLLGSIFAERLQTEPELGFALLEQLDLTQNESEESRYLTQLLNLLYETAYEGNDREFVSQLVNHDLAFLIFTNSSDIKISASVQLGLIHHFSELTSNLIQGDLTERVFSLLEEWDPNKAKAVIDSIVTLTQNEQLSGVVVIDQSLVLQLNTLISRLLVGPELQGEPRQELRGCLSTIYDWLKNVPQNSERASLALNILNTERKLPNLEQRAMSYSLQEEIVRNTDLEQAVEYCLDGTITMSTLHRGVLSRVFQNIHLLTGMESSVTKIISAWAEAKRIDEFATEIDQITAQNLLTSPPLCALVQKAGKLNIMRQIGSNNLANID